MARTRTEPGTGDDRLGFFGLETHIQFETIDVAVQLLGGIRDLWVAVPFQEARIGCVRAMSEAAAQN